MMDGKNAAIMTALLTLSNCGFVYSYRMIGVKLSDAVDLPAIMSLANASSAVAVLMTCFFIALTVFFILLFDLKLEKREKVAATIASCVATIPLSMFVYTNKDAFLVMLLFYMLGLILAAIAQKPINENSFDKLKAGWNASKKVMYMLALGGMVTGTLFASIYRADYENAAKQSIITMATSSLGEANASNPAVQEVIGAVIMKTIETVPVVKTFFDFLPLIVGFTVLATVFMFGQAILVPMTSLLCLALPTEKYEKKLEDFKSVEKFSGLPFSYQEIKREEERKADKKEGI
ncbi:MAG: hypothetical protein QXO69_02590 [archaeon]